MDAAPAGAEDAAAPPPGCVFSRPASLGRSADASCGAWIRARPRRAAAVRAAAAHSSAESDNVEAALALATAARSLVVFTGSGVSASAGMSTFSDPGAFYSGARGMRFACGALTRLAPSSRRLVRPRAAALRPRLGRAPLPRLLLRRPTRGVLRLPGRRMRGGGGSAPHARSPRPRRPRGRRVRHPCRACFLAASGRVIADFRSVRR